MNHQNPIPWRIFIPAILLAVGAVIYTIYWFVMAGRIEQNTALWIEEQRQRGNEVTYDDLSIKGYPYRFEMHFRDFTLAAPNHPNDWVWTSDTLIAMMMAYRFNHVIFESQGLQRIDYIEDLGPVARAPDRYTVEGQTDLMRGSANIRDGRLGRISIDMQNLNATRRGDDILPQPLTAERIQVHVRQSEGDGENTDLYVKADNIHVPTPNGRESHDTPIELIQSKITFEGLREEALLRQGGLTAWLRQGGQTLIDELAFTWDDAGIIGDGNINLDNNARANGKISLRIYGHGKLIRNMVNIGVIDRETGQIVDTALNLAALLNDNKKNHIDTPFAFKKGKIYLGPAQIGKLPPFRFD